MLHWSTETGHGALDRLADGDPPLADVIDRYIKESKKAMATKELVLRAIKRHDIANPKCSQIGSDEVSGFVQELVQKIEPQTVGTISRTWSGFRSR